MAMRACFDRMTVVCVEKSWVFEPHQMQFERTNEVRHHTLLALWNCCAYYTWYSDAPPQTLAWWPYPLPAVVLVPCLDWLYTSNSCVVLPSTTRQSLRALHRCSSLDSLRLLPCVFLVWVTLIFLSVYMSSRRPGHILCKLYDWVHLVKYICNEYVVASSKRIKKRNSQHLYVILKLNNTFHS